MRTELLTLYEITDSVFFKLENRRYYLYYEIGKKEGQSEKAGVDVAGA